MKLIRLATDNNGIFTSAFQNDMIIEKNSQMALLNLTFKTEFENITIDESNNIVTFQSDISTSETLFSGVIAQGTYTSQDLDTYYEAVELGLNSALSLTYSIGDITDQTERNSIYSTFKILTRDDGKKEINYRFAPFLNPFRSLPTGPDRMFFNETDTPQATNLTILSTGDGDVTIRAKSTASVTTRQRTTFGIIDRHLNKGAGIFMARARDIIDNSSGLQDNGFAIGLSNVPIPQGVLVTDMPQIYLENEIRINRFGDEIMIINNGGSEQGTGIYPQKLSATTYPNITDHDVIAFEMSEGNLNFVVYQEARDTDVGQRVVLYTTKVLAGKKYYPYLYVNGGSGNCVVDMVNITLDPFMDGKKNDKWALTGANDDTGMDNKFSDMIEDSANSIRDVIPNVRDQIGWQGTQYTTRLTLHGQVWDTLGYTINGNSNTNVSEEIDIGDGLYLDCWSFWTPQNEPVIKDSDNFIVSSDSVNLDSFDASQAFYTFGSTTQIPNIPKSSDRVGRRKNILMTIPVNDNSNGLVEYESNTPIFIDMNNAEKINLKNINLSILRSDFTQIVAAKDESAVMTILIKKGNE